jgi:predicted ATP-dependent protease
VVLPRRNEPDLEDVPTDVKQEMKFILVDTVDEVLHAALDLQKPPIKRRAAGQGGKTNTKTPRPKDTRQFKNQEENPGGTRP